MALEKLGDLRNDKIGLFTCSVINNFGIESFFLRSTF